MKPATRSLQSRAVCQSKIQKPVLSEGRTDPKSKILLGAHMSIGGGVHMAIQRACSIECTAMQIFVKNNMRWFARPLTRQEISAFLNHSQRHELLSIFAHANYLINLAATNPQFHANSLRSLSEELVRADQLKLPFLVLHPGAHLGAGEEAGLEKIIEWAGHILGPLIVWLAKRGDSAEIDAHGKESLNFQISMLIYNLIALSGAIVSLQFMSTIRKAPAAHGWIGTSISAEAKSVSRRSVLSCAITVSAKFPKCSKRRKAKICAKTWRI
ncbi:MAG: hypothetical protein DME96_14075 [Verrucomicrobia bacterium]|nr:MAG: hypothetical protein DME96_14075 [Verrucomicrobiota bacterium]